MKKVQLIIVAISFLLFFTICSLYNKDVAMSQPTVSFQIFYDELSPYGQWVSYPGHGYAWLPRADLGFRPYFSNGHWTFTNSGWAWVSYYNWGWAPFHYGSWMYDSFYGWMWIPGYDWAPAWVTWGYYGGYYGWAPIGPGFSFTFSNYYPPIDHWCFVDPRYIASRNWRDHHYVSRERRISMQDKTINNVNNITIVENIDQYNRQSFNAGPQRQKVEKLTGETLNARPIRESSRPGRTEDDNDALHIYRPRINNDRTTAKPIKVEPLENIRKNRETSPAIKEERVPIDKNTPINPETRPVQKEHQQQRPVRVPDVAPPAPVNKPRAVPPSQKPQQAPTPKPQSQPNQVKPVRPQTNPAPRPAPNAPRKAPR